MFIDMKKITSILLCILENYLKLQWAWANAAWPTIRPYKCTPIRLTTPLFWCANDLLYSNRNL